MRAVQRLRRGKIDAHHADGNHRSAGSFFLNPVLSSSAAARVFERADALGITRADVPAWALDTGDTKFAAAWLIERSGFSKGVWRWTRWAVVESHPCDHQSRRGDRNRVGRLRERDSSWGRGCFWGEFDARTENDGVLGWRVLAARPGGAGPRTIPVDPFVSRGKRVCMRAAPASSTLRPKAMTPSSCPVMANTRFSQRVDSRPRRPTSLAISGVPYPIPARVAGI